MPRPRVCRRIGHRFDIAYFKPAGVPVSSLEEVVLSVDEAEALRLADLNGMPQEECASKMGVSQPTFHRIVTSARKKVADAVTNGKALKVEGGEYRMLRK
ncbi:MAG: DUF134 domain-containing protein [Candidatus Micrarchaeia archaeon]